MTISAPIQKKIPVPLRGSMPAGHSAGSANPKFTLMPEATTSPAGGSRKGTSSASSTDFFNVRLHPDAAQVTSPLQARAVTRGQDICFHPGQFQPGTPKGEALLAHELVRGETTHAAGRAPRFDYDFSRVRVHAGSRESRLSIGAPGDRYEQEAERVAAEAMTSPGGGVTPAPVEAGPSAGYRMNGGGQLLAGSDRRFFEARLGADLGRVRLHADANAAEAAQTLSAQAFTHGQDIYFGAGRFRPHEAKGRRLLAHELVHTVQQAGISGGSEAHPVMRQTLPGEDAAAAKRRHEMLDNAKATIKEIEQCVAKKRPCAGETVAANGDFQKKGWGNNLIVESPAVRDARLNQLVADLKDIQHQLETAMVPAGSAADVEQRQGGNLQIFSGYDLDNLYVRYALKQGRSYDLAVNNTLYIDHIIEERQQTKPAPVKRKKKPAPHKTTAAETKPTKPEDAEPPKHFEEKTPFTIVVPDPQNAPLVYHILLSGFDDNRGYILDVFRDEKGHFYRGPHDKKVYLPNWHDPY